MIPPEVLTRKSLFSLLYKIDQDLTEQTRAKGCPIAGVRCTAPITSASLGAVPLIFTRLLRCASACAAAARAAGAGFYRHRFGSGGGEYTGRLSFCWSPPFDRAIIRPSRWSASRDCAVSGDRRSNDGNATSKIFSPTATLTGVCAGASCAGALRTRCPGHLSGDFTGFITLPRRHWPTA
jgi:hypothetical protein